MAIHLEKKLESQGKRKSKMRCPNCGYTYIVISEPYEWENCPMPNCGYHASFERFVIEQSDK